MPARRARRDRADRWVQPVPAAAALSHGRHRGAGLPGWTARPGGAGGPAAGRLPRPRRGADQQRGRLNRPQAVCPGAVQPPSSRRWQRAPACPRLGALARSRRPARSWRSSARISRWRSNRWTRWKRRAGRSWRTPARQLVWRPLSDAQDYAKTPRPECFGGLAILGGCGYHSLKGSHAKTPRPVWRKCPNWCVETSWGWSVYRRREEHQDRVSFGAVRVRCLCGRAYLNPSTVRSRVKKKKKYLVHNRPRQFCRGRNRQKSDPG